MQYAHFRLVAAPAPASSFTVSAVFMSADAACSHLAVGKTVILLHPHLPSVGVSIVDGERVPAK